MSPADAIQVIERTPARVVIIEPPFYSFGGWMLFLAVASLAAAGYLYARGAMTPLGWVAIAVGLALGAFGGSLMTSQRRITLSKADGLLTIEKTSWGATGTQATIRLQDIRTAHVRDFKNNHQIIVVLSDGQELALGDGSNRDGYYAAVDVINSYLEAATK